jgi:hypothetical protein
MMSLGLQGTKPVIFREIQGHPVHRLLSMTIDTDLKKFR